MSGDKKETTAVLVHAAWADGSSWNKVTKELQDSGFSVVAAQIPQTSFGEDVAAVVPDEGETVGDVFHRVAPHPRAPKLQPDAGGFVWLDVEAFRTAVAPDASLGETALMAATQKPIALKCLGERMTAPAWKEKRSWFLIAEKDVMVSPETQRFTAERMKSKVVSLAVDHTPLASAPHEVAEVIVTAANHS